LKALVKKTNEETLSYEDIPEPVTKPGHVKIEVVYAGICGTDYHILHNEYKHNLPIVPGHEFSGRIVDVGEDVSDFKVGDRVVALTTYQTCGKCEYCISGIKMLCSERKSFGTHVNGTFTKYIVLNAQLLFKIPENVSFEEAALTEPLACCVRGLVEMAKVNSSDTVFISGPGTIGLISQQVAQAEGGTVFVCGTSQDKDRLAKAKVLGAYDTIDLNRDDLELIRAKNDGCGVNLAVECAGVEISAHNCVEIIKPGGRYHQMGLYGKPINLDMDAILRKEITITTSYASTSSSFRKSLVLMARKKIQLKPLISAKLPLQAWEEGFEMFSKKNGYKVLLYPE
jgi:L-iditol 2-dehydrogenase